MFGPVPILNNAAGEYPRRYFFERNDFMASEYSAVFVQQVAANQNVLFSDTPVRGGNCVVHREGAGIVTLRGQTNQCRALFKVSFGANIGLPAGGTVGPVSVALSVDGEPLGNATAIVTPAATGDVFNVYVSAIVCVPRGCCVTVSVKNVTTPAQTIEVENANLLVERIA